MSRKRWVIALASLAIVVALMIWHSIRYTEMKRCAESGGLWDGPRSRCVPDPMRPILRRDLQRS